MAVTSSLSGLSSKSIKCAQSSTTNIRMLALKFSHNEILSQTKHDKLGTRHRSIQIFDESKRLARSAGTCCSLSFYLHDHNYALYDNLDFLSVLKHSCSIFHRQRPALVMAVTLSSFIFMSVTQRCTSNS